MTLLTRPVNTTFAWSVAAIALVGLLYKSAESWKVMWLKAASDAGVPAGHATGAMFATHSMALIGQPFLLGALLSAALKVAAIVIGAFCLVCAAAFFPATRKTSLSE